MDRPETSMDSKGDQKTSSGNIKTHVTIQQDQQDQQTWNTKRKQEQGEKGCDRYFKNKKGDRTLSAI